MDFDNYRELIELVNGAPNGVTVVVSFTPAVTDEDSNEEYPTMVVTNTTDPAMVSALTQMLSDDES